MIKRLITTRALRQGLLGGSPFWRVVWIAQFVYKKFGSVSKAGEPPITFDEPLKEGEVWAVVHEPAKTKAGRGEGRKFLIGPKRKKSRANTMTGLALGVMGEKILAAPSAERINAILGEDVFEPPAPTRAQKKARKKSTKLAAKAAKVEASDAKNAFAANAKAAKREEKAAAKLVAASAAAEKKLAAANAAAAKKERAAAAKLAREEAKTAKAAKATRAANKAAKRDWRERKLLLAEQDKSGKLTPIANADGEAIKLVAVEVVDEADQT